MTDGDTFTALWGDRVANLTQSRRNPDGRPTLFPTCSAHGDTNPIAQLVDPIDPLNPRHDTHHLIGAQRNLQHQAHVLTLAILRA